MFGRIGRAFVASGTFMGAMYAGNRYAQSKNSTLPEQDALDNGEGSDPINDTVKRYTRMAPIYDELLDKVESAYSGFTLRHKLLSNAEGHVLEIGTGTSRNIVDYSLPKVKTLTLTDNTEAMLRSAVTKHCDLWNLVKVPGVLISNSLGNSVLVRAKRAISAFPPTVQALFANTAHEIPLKDISFPDGKELPKDKQGNGYLWQERAVRSNTLPVAFVKADSHDLSVFASNSFDTVVDTFGLCSYADPVKVLHEMQRVCKDGGKILLLEHGKGDGILMNTVISLTNETHQQQWGCDRSKDINQFIKDSGLIVTTSMREHQGTTYFVVAKPNKKV